MEHEHVADRAAFADVQLKHYGGREMLRFRLGGIDSLDEMLDRRRSRQMLGRDRIGCLLWLSGARSLLCGGRGREPTGTEEQQRGS